MLRKLAFSSLIIATLFTAACAADSDGGTTGTDPGTEPGTPGTPGTSQSASFVCFYTDTDILCGDIPADDEELAQRVEDFYPSACFASDEDDDNVPDFVDADSYDDGYDGSTAEAELRCQECNRGPGNEGDFRLKIDGGQAELERGKILVAGDGTLLVPTPDGVLTIIVTAATEVRDGQPRPGAEIRARGVLDETEALVAERVEVLCPGPEPLLPEEIPTEAEPVDPEQGTAGSGGSDGSSGSSGSGLR